MRTASTIKEHLVSGRGLTSGCSRQAPLASLAPRASEPQAVSLLSQQPKSRKGERKSDWARGIALLEQGHFKGAISCFDKLIDEDQQDAGTWFHKGYCLNQQRITTLLLPVSMKYLELARKQRISNGWLGR